MARFVVIVDLQLRSGASERFRELINTNARASIRDEPGCHRFDVTEVRGEPGRILLYEIYDSEAAFEEHCRTAHFEAFNAMSAPLVERKQVTLCDLVFEEHA